MIKLIKKADQFNGVIFNGNFHTNKSVTQGDNKDIAPYSNIFYWSHARATGPCEFGLHSHEGFEIMTFIWDGDNKHYDTASQKWTPLIKGDFQVIQSGSGVQHAEKLIAGTRSFQIWFDPDFAKSLSKAPAYKDYSITQWESLKEDGFHVNYYIGGNSPAKSDTAGLIIKKFTGDGKGPQHLNLMENYNYHFYMLNGSAILNGHELAVDDVLKATNMTNLDISIQNDTELFLIQTPVTLSYRTVWE